MNNYTRIPSSENFSSNVERKNAKSKATAKKVAAVALSAAVLFSAAANHEKVGKWVNDSFTYSSIDKNVAGPKVESSSYGKPDVLLMFNLDKLMVNSRSANGEPEQYMTDNAETIDVYKVNDGEIPIIEKGADVRTSPVVGSPEDGTKTTIVTLKEQVPLNNVKDYYYYEMGNDLENSYVGFKVGDIQKSFPNVKMQVDNDNIDWISARDVNFVSSAKK